MKETIEVKGMHCRSCEVLLEGEIKQIPGIKKVHANAKKGELFIYSDEEIDKNLIIKAVKEAGYEVGVEDLPLISNDNSEYYYLIFAAILFAVILVIGKNLGLASFFTSNYSNASGIWVALGVGLAAGFSTCMALVGGLILGVSARFAEKHQNESVWGKFKPHLFFNFGRIISYFLLGGLIGELGSVLKLSGSVLGYITLLVAVIMFILGLQLIEIFPRLSNGFVLPKSITAALGIQKRKEKEYSHFNSMVLGALTFFLPCGFTQAMQVLAISSGNFIRGALIMGLFAVGTTPGLLAIGGLTAIVKKGFFSKFFFKFVGIILIALGTFNFSNALNLTGLKTAFVSFGKSESVNRTDKNVVQKDGVQVVNMTQTAFGYSPKQFTIKKGIPVKWLITSTSSQTCASSIVMPKLGIEKILEEGQNEIDFTPASTGKLTFTCAMGMYSGYFNVIQ